MILLHHILSTPNVKDSKQLNSRELCTSKQGGTTEEPVALITKHKGPKNVEKSSFGQGEGQIDCPKWKTWRQKGTCWACGKVWFCGHDCPSQRNSKGPKNPNQSPDKDKSMFRPGPIKPAGGSLLWATEEGKEGFDEVQFTTETGIERHYTVDINSGATGHFTNNVMALHDYMPFDKPHNIKMAQRGNISALGSGMLKFTLVMNGEHTRGMFKEVYYIPDIRTQLISLTKLFNQKWNPQLSKDGITIHDEGRKVIHFAPRRNQVFTVML